MYTNRVHLAISYYVRCVYSMCMTCEARDQRRVPMMCGPAWPSLTATEGDGIMALAHLAEKGREGEGDGRGRRGDMTVSPTGST